MPNKSGVIKTDRRIHGGIRLTHFKNTEDCKSVVMPSPDVVVIAMQQHIGAPCVPTVKKGDKVFVGTMVGNTDEKVSAPVHSSVSGTVSGIVQIMLPMGQICDAIKIESDGQMTVDPTIKPVTIENNNQLVEAARACGLVGLGGAGFPAHIKLTASSDKKADILIINGAECEPYITADYRECIECANDILEGIYLIKKVMGFSKVIIAIEDNKPKAIEILLNIANDKRDTNESVNVMKLPSHYPQGAEKVLIYTTTGRKQPFGKLPSDVGCVVMNITSVAFLNKYIRTGMPLVSKRITVDGNAINVAQNVVVPIGTSYKDVIDFCGGMKDTAAEVIMGGPMMGISIADLSSPVLKQNNALIVLSQEESVTMTTQCIRCARCAGACPMNLQPFAVDAALRKNNIDIVKNLAVKYCIECGCCAFSCPAKRPLVQTMRMAKTILKK